MAPLLLFLPLLMGLLKSGWALDVGCNCTLVKGVDWGEDVLEATLVPSAEACCHLCTLQESRCLVWAWDSEKVRLQVACINIKCAAIVDTHLFMYLSLFLAVPL